MKKTESSGVKEAGWEFTVPGYVASPVTWLILLLAGVALLLLFILINKVL